MGFVKLNTIKPLFTGSTGSNIIILLLFTVTNILHSLECNRTTVECYCNNNHDVIETVL